MYKRQINAVLETLGGHSIKNKYRLKLNGIHRIMDVNEVNQDTFNKLLKQRIVHDLRKLYNINNRICL